MRIPGERRGVVAAAAATTLAAAVIAVTALLSWDSNEGTGVVAVAVGIAALTVACAGLAGYTLWLRQAVSRRMAQLLRPYLVSRPSADGMTVPAVAAPMAVQRTLVGSTVEN